MPISLSPLSRREFVAASLAASLVANRAWGDEAKADPHRFALLADTHIPAAPDVMGQGIKMHDHFVQVAREILELKARPSAALILGDCAYLSGQDADYALLVKLLEPLRTAGFPVHLILGNHDHRERFWKALPASDGQNKHVADRHLTIIPAPRANWFLLDSLDVTNKAPGVLGEKQLAWLGKALDQHTDKPALVAVHHNPDLKPMPGGLVDTQPLYDVLLPRKHVKALFFGHTHVWNQDVKDGLHLINLPPVAYVFAKGKPSGFVELELLAAGGKLTLHALAKDHAQHGQTLELKWR